MTAHHPVLMRRVGLLGIVSCALMTVLPTNIAGEEVAPLRPGDRVEVHHAGELSKGTIVRIESGSNWVEVRLDEDGQLPAEVPQIAREQFLMQSFPMSQVKRLLGAREGNAQPPNSPRTWSDRSGKFRVEANLDGMNGDRVVLIRTDGKRIEVPLNRLSKSDMEYVQELQESAENPFEEVAVIQESEAAEISMAPRRADWGSVRQVRPRKFTKWSFAPPPNAVLESTTTEGGNHSTRLSEIAGSEKFFEKTHGIYASRDGQRAVLVREKGEVGHDSPQFLEVIDKESRSSQGLINLPADSAVLDVLADEQLVMLRPDIFGSGSNGLLTIARIDGSQLRPILAWNPYAHEEWEPSRDIKRAWFLSKDRVMTINGHGKALTVWDVDTTRALYSVPVENEIGLKLALNADRTLLAVIMERGVAILDLVAGEHVATLSTDEGQTIRQVAFRNDGRRLAGASQYGMVLWDLETGEEQIEFDQPAGDFANKIDWAGGYLLVDHRYLFDPERRILLWEYHNAPGVGMMAELSGGYLWIVPDAGSDGDTMLVAARVPHPGAMRKAASLPPAEELLVVRPGDEVAISVDIDPTVTIPNEIRQSLIDRFGTLDEGEGEIVVLDSHAEAADLIRKSLAAAVEAAGLTLVEESPLVLRAICKPQEQQTIRINVDNRFPVRESDIVERTVTPHASYLELSLHGEPLWKRGYIAGPGHVIFLNNGEDLDQALERLTKPNIRVFTDARISGYVARPGKATENGAYGASEFAAAGLIDISDPRNNDRFQ